jgi:gliding motility-associated-like protein
MLRILLSGLLFILPAIVIAQPVANFTASPTSGCAPMVVAFTNTSTGNPTSFSWNFGNGNTSTSASPTTSYTVPGTYTVTLTATNASGSNTKTSTNLIVVKQVPTVSFGASPLAACPGAAISYFPSVTWNAPGSGTYVWDFGDGGSSTSSSPTHSYSASGTYTVKLTATNSVNCPSTDTQANLITIYPKPVADFTATDTAICALSGSTTFISTSTGSGLSYLWDFGDGSSPGTGSSVTHAYSSAGTYTVRLIATSANGCSDTMTKSSFIRVRVVNAGFSGPTSACQSSSVPFASTSATTSGAAVNWNFGDGGTATGSSTAHSYSTAGTYVVTQTATIGGCNATATGSITINPRPSVSFTYSPAAPCPATVNVSFNASPSTGLTYNWFYGDGFSGSGPSVSHFYTKNDTFTVTLNAYNSYGCSGSAAADVIIYPMRLYAKSDVDDGCAPLMVTFGDSLITWDDTNGISPYPYAITAYHWDFGDGSSSSSKNAVHSFLNPGTYQTILTVTTANGCTISDTLDIKAGNLPVVNFGAGQRIACVNEPIRFFDSSTSSGLAITDWKWDFGDGRTDKRKNPIYAYQLPDTFTVVLHVGINGCWDSLTKVDYIIVKYPKSVPLHKVSCDTPLLVHFVDSSLGATSHIWYFGDGTTSTAANPNHNYPATGLYTYSLVAFNSATGCKDSVSRQLNLNPAILTISALDTTLCRGDSLRVQVSVGGGATASEYAWWIGTGTSTPVFNYNGLPKDTSKKAFRVNSPGRYHVAIEIKDQNSCRTSTTRNNYIMVGGPIAKFSAKPPIGCLPYATVVFTDSSTYPTGTFAVTRNWDFGDGSSGTTGAQTIAHPYSSTGSFGITLKVTDNLGCTDSLTLLNYLQVSRAVAIFTTTSPNACVGVPFTFFSSSTGTGLKYLWDFGDGGTSTASSPSHAYASTGTYNVSLIVTDAIGCKDTMTKPSAVTVNTRPQASFVMDDTIAVCPPLIVKFTNTSVGAVRYNWTFGTGATSTLQNPSNTYTVPQIYTVRLIATNAAGCSDTAYGRVRILGYDGALTYTPLKGCAPLTVQFQANNVDGVAGFIFDFGDGTTAASTGTKVSHTYTRPGPYKPKITLTDNLGCYVTSSGIDTIKVDGVYAGFTFSPFPACGGGTITFIDTSKGAFSALNPPFWRFHDGTTSNLPSPTMTYKGPGTYKVTLHQSTVTGCLDTLNTQIVFHALPVIRAMPDDTIICLSDSARLQATGGRSYAWTPSADVSCPTCDGTFVYPKSETKFYVTGTDSNGCKNTDSVMVRMRIKTDATVGEGDEICSGEVFQLNATGGTTYQWSPPTGLSNPNIANPKASPNTDQHYMVISRLGSCIPDTDYVNLIVHPTPTVDAGKDQSMIAGDEVQLKATGTGPITSYSWTPPEGLSCVECITPIARPKSTTVYVITVSTEFDCRAVDSVRIHVQCDNGQVFIPNTFTPEGNGVNDVFYPRGKGLQVIERFRIYDRWGQVVFEKTNIQLDDRNAGWDGRKDGRLLSPDVYVYTVEAICDTGEPIRWQGDVMLLR